MKIPKYKIHQLLIKLPKEDYDKCMKSLPDKLGVTQRTFYRWKSLKIEDPSEIPADKLFQLAQFFGVKMEDMFNFEPPKIELLNNETDLAKQLGLNL